jgi:hypothetical protein
MHAPPRTPTNTPRGTDWIFSAAHIVSRTAPAPKALRAANAVALRASLGPDAYLGTSAWTRRSPIPITDTLDSPRSFRNDLPELGDEPADL